MYGIFINGKRPASKKEIRICAADAHDVRTIRLEATSYFGNEYDGLLSDAPDGTYTFVGPDPERNRKFYGNITKTGDVIKIT